MGRAKLPNPSPNTLHQKASQERMTPEELKAHLAKKNERQKIRRALRKLEEAERAAASAPAPEPGQAEA